MGDTARALRDVQKQIEADDGALDEARTRRNTSLQICRSFPGVLRTYRSGSLAMGVVIDPVVDADCGVVLDRRFYRTLGPEGDGEPPVDVVRRLHDHVAPRLEQTWAMAKVRTMKRGIRVFKHDPQADGDDPYVDIVIALTRRNGNGLWIPNLKTRQWDASDPENHVELMMTGSRGLRRTRARVVRLAKAWNQQYTEPALSSFNVCALGLEAITTPMDIDEALCAFFSHAASSLRRGLTDDPAGVSGPIQLKRPKPIAVERVQAARDNITEAVSQDDDPAVVHAAMHALFWRFLPKPASGASRTAVAELLRSGTPRLRTTPAGIAVAGAVKQKRAFGSR